ncbi:MAG: Electron transfer flavoprotein, alpha subunit, partial [uncultured bacterium]
MTVLLIVEHDCRTIKQATYHAMTAAAQFNQAVDLLIIGKDCHTVAAMGSTLPGISKVLVADHACYEHQLPENCSVLIANLAKNYEVVLAAATTFGKNILPRVAALLDKAMLSDVIKIISPDTFVRPIYAGNVLQTVQLLESIKILTIRATAFQAVTLGESPVATMSTIDQPIQNTLSQFESVHETQSVRPELTTARVVVSGGRGLKSAEHFKMVESLADCLKGAVGASRAVV